MQAADNAYSARWFSNFLDTIPEQKTEREVAFFARHIPTGSRVLDVCCGPGRHAGPLAQRGYAVTGIDLDIPALVAARARSVHAVACDMRTIHAVSARPFDAVLNAWASFGYFAAATNAAVLEAIAASIDHDGRVILDLYNRDFFERHAGANQSTRPSGSVRIGNTLTGDRLRAEILYADGELEHFDWQVFSPQGIHSLAASCGLTVATICAGFDEHCAPSHEEPRMQCILERL